MTSPASPNDAAEATSDAAADVAADAAADGTTGDAADATADADAGAPPDGATSSWVDLDGPVHYADYGGPADGPLMLLVHGLGGSAVNWAAITAELAADHRVLAIDLVGFGRTQQQGRSITVQDNAALLGRFIDEVCRQPVILVGNSMGGLIAILLTARRPELVAGLVLVDPALPVGLRARPSPLVTAMFGIYALPAVGRIFVRGRRSRLSAEQEAYAVLRLCTVDPERVPRPVLAAHAALARERAGYPTSTRSSSSRRARCCSSSAGGGGSSGGWHRSRRRCCCCTATRTGSSRSRRPVRLPRPTRPGG